MIICNPSIYTMDHTTIIVCSFMENSIGLRTKFTYLYKRISNFIVDVFCCGLREISPIKCEVFWWRFHIMWICYYTLCTSSIHLQTTCTFQRILSFVHGTASYYNFHTLRRHVYLKNKNKSRQFSVIANSREWSLHTY